MILVTGCQKEISWEGGKPPVVSSTCQVVGTVTDSYAYLLGYGANPAEYIHVIEVKTDSTIYRIAYPDTLQWSKYHVGDKYTFK